jgi:Arc/MetJ family transcription regulator
MQHLCPTAWDRPRFLAGRNFGFDAAAVQGGPHPQDTVYLIGHIAYGQDGHRQYLFMLSMQAIFCVCSHGANGGRRRTAAAVPSSFPTAWNALGVETIEARTTTGEDTVSCLARCILPLLRATKRDAPTQGSNRPKVAGRRMCTMPDAHTHQRSATMRTNILIDDQLMERALAVSGCRTKREAVEEGLRLLVRLKEQEQIRAARGKLTWDGDLDAMRRDDA